MKQVKAVVSRGGRPDLASVDDLKEIEAPVLLIVGGLDEKVLELNEWALEKLRCVKELVIVHGASHLFEEEGTLDEVAKLALAWFGKHLDPRVVKTA
jgi:pimeloyl-ACP methyl ester carboxylesterase